MRFANGLIWLNAIVFVAYGAGFAVAPEALAIWVTGSAPGTPSGLIDLRATYGGMSIGLGLFFALTARDPSRHRLGLQAVLVVMVCMAGTRLLGITLDGTPNSKMWIYLALEILVAGLAGWGLWR